MHQPYASLIASGKKTLETRKWPTNHRGPLLICAAKKSPGQSPGRPGRDLPAGVALCVVEVLKNVRVIDPFPVSGKQGFYYVDLPSGILEKNLVA